MDVINYLPVHNYLGLNIAGGTISILDISDVLYPEKKFQTAE
jgi:hypothetical protein